MYTGGTGTPDADGFKPWCLRSSIDDRIVRSDHNSYKRSSCKGKKTKKTMTGTVSNTFMDGSEPSVLIRKLKTNFKKKHTTSENQLTR